MDEFDYQLKFVIAPGDLDEVRGILAELKADSAKVVLMPEGVTHEATQARGLWLTEICKTEGFRYSPRLHVDLWGDKRGVWLLNSQRHRLRDRGGSDAHRDGLIAVGNVRRDDQVELIQSYESGS